MAALTAWMLPRSLDPLPDETLPGYVLRLPCRLERAPGRTARLTGLTPVARADRGGYVPVARAPCSAMPRSSPCA